MAMISSTDVIILFVSCLGFSLIPGPSLVYFSSNTLTHGLVAGLSMIAGIFVGSQFHVIIASIGLAGMLITMPWLLTLIKVFGGVYFFYLGVKRAFGVQQNISDHIVTKSKFFAEGIVVEFLNPKSCLFYLAFIPQFIVSGYGVNFLSMFFIGSLSNLFITLGDILIVVTFSFIGRRYSYYLGFYCSRNGVQSAIFVIIGFVIIATSLV